MKKKLISQKLEILDQINELLPILSKSSGNLHANNYQDKDQWNAWLKDCGTILNKIKDGIKQQEHIDLVFLKYQLLPIF